MIHKIPAAEGPQTLVNAKSCAVMWSGDKIYAKLDTDEDWCFVMDYEPELKMHEVLNRVERWLGRWGEAYGHQTPT